MCVRVSRFINARIFYFAREITFPVRLVHACQLILTIVNNKCATMGAPQYEKLLAGARARTFALARGMTKLTQFVKERNDQPLKCRSEKRFCA